MAFGDLVSMGMSVAILLEAVITTVRTVRTAPFFLRVRSSSLTSTVSCLLVAARAALELVRLALLATSYSKTAFLLTAVLAILSSALSSWDRRASSLGSP